MDDLRAALTVEPEWPYDQGLGNQPTITEAFQAGVEAARRPIIAALAATPEPTLDAAPCREPGDTEAMADEDSREVGWWRLGWNAAVYAFGERDDEGNLTDTPLARFPGIGVNRDGLTNAAARLHERTEPQEPGS